MDKKEVAKELEVLLRSINMHFKDIEPDIRIPSIELDLITQKVARLYEKFVMYKLLLQQEDKQTGNRIRTEVQVKLDQLRKDAFTLATAAAEEKKNEPEAGSVNEVVVAPVSENHTPPVTRDLKKLIGLNDRLLFTANLFAGKQDAFMESLGRLEKASGQADAELILAGLQKQFGWASDDETADAFKTLIKKSFIS